MLIKAVYTHMRALSFRNAAFFSRASLATLSSSRVWCSAQTSKEDGSSGPKDTPDYTKKENTPITQEAFGKMEKELAKAKEELDELKKEILYRAADAENARRIGREDVEKARKYGITSFSKDMLEVVDTLEKGIEVMSNVTEADLEANKHLCTIHTGVKLSLKILLNNLAKHGVEKVDVQVGHQFDPNIHDALLKIPPTDKFPSGQISHVLKTGYMIGGRVLRAPQVGVAQE